jgi:hypothetical protein
MAKLLKLVVLYGSVEGVPDFVYSGVLLGEPVVDLQRLGNRAVFQVVAKAVKGFLFLNQDHHEFAVLFPKF